MEDQFIMKEIKSFEFDSPFNSAKKFFEHLNDHSAWQWAC